MFVQLFYLQYLDVQIEFMIRQVRRAEEERERVVREAEDEKKRIEVLFTFSF